MTPLKALSVRKIVTLSLMAVLLVGLVVVSLVVAFKWFTIDVSWNEKTSPGRVEQQRPVLPQGDPVDTVHPVFQPYFEESFGTLKAATRTEIAARVLAPIQRMMVHAGQKVNQGDDLIILDRRALETERSKINASLVAAQASLDQAEKDYARAAKLVEKHAISKQQYDENQARVEVAEANLDYARQALAEADVKLSYTVIKAPKSGIIVDRLAEEGNMAQPGVPLLILYDPTSLRLEVPVPESLAVRLSPGDKLDVRIDALKNRPTVKATIDEIVPQAQAASRSFLVKVALPKSPDLFEGMSGRLLVPAGTRRFLCLNTAAIERIGQLEMVYVVHPDRTLERRIIKTGRAGQFDASGRPTRVEVLSGLDADETVRLREPPAISAPGERDQPTSASSTESP
ncbi:MAG: efflux RND transporter periplasmic adaptor subunit [Pirellulales bacterium]|nr:efflux RND transporter periplasmic adaptor subunit [Pirellulales bacterium]